MLSSDYHFPHNDKRATDLWFQAVEYFQPDAIDYVGDIDDCSQYSRWTDGRPSEFLQKYKAKDTHDIASQIWLDAEPARRFYEKTRKLLPQADIHVSLGNHDARITEYVEKKLPDLIDTVTEDFVWEFSRNNITYSKYSAKPLKRFGNLYVHHGQAISKHSGESVKADMESWGISLARGHCFSGDTELLTDKGWRNYKDINVGDRALTLQKDMTTSFEVISDKFVYHDYDELIRIKSAIVDILVTPDHRMLQTSGDSYRFVKAKDLPKSFTIPLAGQIDAVDANISDEWLKLCSWFMAEGNFDKYTTSSGEVRSRMRICQSDVEDGRLDRVKAIVKACGIDANWIKRYSAGETEHGQYRNYDAYRANLTRKQSLKMLEYLNEDGKTPKGELLRLSARQARIFLEEYVWSDGSKNSAAQNSYQVSTNNSEIADYLQTLATIAGYRSSMIPRPKGMFCITFNTRSVTKIHDGVSREKYSGDVWCVTVPSHTLILRRNGKVFAAGNSHRQGYAARTYDMRNETLLGYEIGHMTDVHSPGMAYTNIHNWQHGFGYAYIDGDNVHMNLVHIKPDYSCVVDGKLFRA